MLENRRSRTLSGGGRLGALLSLLAATAAVGYQLHRSNRVYDLQESFDARLEGAISKGNILEAAQLVEELNALRPETAALRLQKLNFHLSRSETPLMERALALLNWDRTVDASRHSGPRPVPPAPEDCQRLEGVPAVRYFRKGTEKNVELLPELLSVLGKNSVGEMTAEEEPREGQSIVVAPDPALRFAQVPRASVHYLAPNDQAEEVLGLDGKAVEKGANCRFLTRDPALGPIARRPVSVPVDGPVSTYHLGTGVKVLATLRCDAAQYPALLRLERPGGPVDMFTFDVLHAIVRLRQGDPALANHETDGVEGLRPSDLFPYRLSAEELRVPFTDLLILGLVHLIEGDRPALRMWHHTSGTYSSLVLSSDQDFSDTLQLSLMAATLHQAGASTTFMLTAGTYLNDQAAPPVPSVAWVAGARPVGMDFGAHPNFPARAGHPREQVIAEQQQVLSGHYGAPPEAIRFHFLRWHGWVEPIRDSEKAGYRYDLNYVTLLSDSFLGMGYMTGSGLPIHFYDENGQKMQVVQLSTQLDDAGNPTIGPVPFDKKGWMRKLSRKDYVEQPLAVLHASASLFHSSVILNNHPLQFFYDPDWLLTIIAAARSENIGLFNVAEYASFQRALVTSSFTLDDRSSNTYHVCVQNERQDILLLDSGTPPREVLVDDRPVPVHRERRYDRDVSLVTVLRGKHRLAWR